uniref:U4/U6.U5 small nuclear ribonucleoprotein 27 kDa protein n=1 Tax=Anopheles dirus TaxID=7168 RepID=A0A182NNR7_9DIPT
CIDPAKDAFVAQAQKGARTAKTPEAFPGPQRKRSIRGTRPETLLRAGQGSGPGPGSRQAKVQIQIEIASYERSLDKATPSSSSRRAAQMKPMVSESELEGKTPEEQEMLKTMGFCGFDTTKGKKVEGNDVGEVHVILKRKYRQYMNRKGGFNRPLDFVA